ncbi:MAG: alpha/beta hydrolase family protein, partial [Gaiellaceae bacterium]
MPILIALARFLLGATVLFAAGLAGTASHPSHAAAPPRLSVLPPSGPFHVATISRQISDPARPTHATMIQLFYPTSAAHGRPALYMPKRTADLTAKALHYPAPLVESIETHVLAGAPALPGARPVVLFSPGLTELRSDATALTEDLASRGYIVVALDHPTESAVVEFPDGHIATGSFHDSNDPATSTRLRGQLVEHRIGDIKAVVAALSTLNAQGPLHGRLDLKRIGMFGFSLGGAATASAMRALPQIRAGVDLDGSIYGSALRKPLDRPFLFLARDGHSNQTDTSWAADWKRLRGWRRQIHLIGAGHGDFSDTASFLHQLNPGATDPSGYYGPINPDQATIATRTMLVAFFDRFLRGATSAGLLLDHP